MLQPESHPTKARLGEVHLQVGEAVEHARKHHLADAQGGAHALGDNPVKEMTPQRAQHLRVVLGIDESGVRCPGPVAVELNVGRQRHVHVQRSGPELVVLRSGIALGTGEGAQHDALQAQLGAMLHLGDAVVHASPRQDAHGKQAVAIDRSVLLTQPVVIGPDHRLVDLVVAYAAPQAGAGDHGWVEHLGGHAVGILLPKPLVRRAGASGVFYPQARRLPLPLGASCAQIEEESLLQGPALNHLGLPAVGQLHCARCAVAVLLRHPVGPPLRQHLKVTVSRDNPTVICHRFLPVCAWGSSCSRQGASLTSRGSRL